MTTEKRTKTAARGNVEKSTTDLFDTTRIKKLAEMMRELGLSELDIQQDASRLLLRRENFSNAPSAATNFSPSFAPSAISAPPQISQSLSPPTNSAPAAPSAPANLADEAHLVTIKSPMVGTFYSAPKPDAPAYVKVGDIISPEKNVCLIEAMKVYNEIQAEVSGKVVAVLVKNGEAVDVNKPLFKIDSRG